MSEKRSKTIRQRIGAIFAYLAWKAGIQYSPDRGYVGWGTHIQSPNEANDVRSREEVIRKAQDFERNNPIVHRLLDVFELYTVGAGGMPIIPASEDEEWNENRKMLWQIWCRSPDLTSLQSFGVIQSLIARRWAVDGQVFVYKTVSDTRVEGPGGLHYRPRIQIIESARVRTPSDLSGRQDITDGVHVDKRGRPLGYYVATSTGRQSFGKESFTYIEAKDMIVCGEPMRPAEYRPFSFFAPCLDDLQDLEELCAFAMRKAKRNGRITGVYKTETGEVPKSLNIRQRALIDQPTETAAGTQTVQQRLEFIQQATGSVAIAIKPTEDYEEKGAQAPNEVELNHWNVRIDRICLGFGVTKQLVFPYSIQGTIGRADLDTQNQIFQKWSATLQEVFLRIYEYVTAEEMRFSPLIADAPRDWKLATVRAPRGCNVDVGRNSSAMLAELDAGATNYDLIFGPLGLDAKEQLRKSAMYAKYIRNLAKEFEVEPGEIRKTVSEVLAESMAKENEKRNREEDAIPA